MHKNNFIAGINWPGTAVLVFVGIAWEAAVRSGLLEYEYLPAPSAIGLGFGELAGQGILAPDIAHTLIEKHLHRLIDKADRRHREQRALVL